VYDAAFSCANDMIHRALVNLVSMFDETMQNAHIVLAGSYINNNIIRGKYKNTSD